MQSNAVTSNWRRYFWLVLLIAASVATSLGFACAVPLAAFAAAGALTLPRRDALLLVGAVWFTNQVVGFSVLDYPWTANSIAWGVALGLVAVLSTVAAFGAARYLDGVAPVGRTTAAFFVSFVVYEGALFTIAAVLLGGTEDFTPAIIGRIFAINAIGMAALFVANRLGAVIGLVAPVGLHLSPIERHA